MSEHVESTSPPYQEQGNMLVRIGGQLEFAGQWDEAEARYRKALALAMESGNRGDQAQAQLALGRLQHKRGEYEAGLALLRQAKENYAAIEDRAGLSRVLVWLGTLGMQHAYYGNFQEPYAALQEGLTLARELGDTQTVALALQSLGNRYQYTGQLEECLAVQRELGDSAGMATTLLKLGMQAEYKGDPKKAEDYYLESLALGGECDNNGHIAEVLTKLGELAWLQRDYSLARQRLAESLAFYQELGDAQEVARLRLLLGHVWLDQGEWLPARAQFAESMALSPQEGDKLKVGYSWASIAEGLVALAAIAARRQENGMPTPEGAERAVRLLATAVACLIKAGVTQERLPQPLEPVVGTHLYELPIQLKFLLPTWSGYRRYEHTLLATRAVLDEARFAAAWHAGLASSPEEATKAGLAEKAETLIRRPAADLDPRLLLQALQALQVGNFAVRLPDGQPGVSGEIATAFNMALDTLNDFAIEATRIMYEIGHEGTLGGQVGTRGLQGGWEALALQINMMASNITGQLRNISEVASHLAEGGSSKMITAPARGEVLLLQETLNRVVARAASEPPPG